MRLRKIRSVPVCLKSKIDILSDFVFAFKLHLSKEYAVRKRDRVIDW